MGRLTTEGYADAVRTGAVSLTQALEAHLTSNHYPPLPYPYVRVAQQALERARAGDWDARVPLGTHTCPLPKTATQNAQSGAWYALAGDLIEAMHLEPFLEIEKSGEGDEG
jgi:hypothetical protein